VCSIQLENALPAKPHGQLRNRAHLYFGPVSGGNPAPAMWKYTVSFEAQFGRGLALEHNRAAQGSDDGLSIEEEK
jgi:hypothetical protein